MGKLNNRPKVSFHATLSIEDQNGSGDSPSTNVEIGTPTTSTILQGQLDVNQVQNLLRDIQASLEKGQNSDPNLLLSEIKVLIHNLSTVVNNVEPLQLTANNQIPENHLTIDVNAACLPLRKFGARIEKKFKKCKKFLKGIWWINGPFKFFMDYIAKPIGFIVTLRWIYIFLSWLVSLIS